jgi:hypothetical protein
MAPQIQQKLKEIGLERSWGGVKGVLIMKETL